VNFGELFNATKKVLNSIFGGTPDTSSKVYAAAARLGTTALMTRVVSNVKI